MNPAKIPPTLCQDLVQLYDNFAEFTDYCSFLCDTVPGLFSEEFDLDDHTIQGVRRHFSWLKLRAEELKLDLDEIQQRVCGQLQND
jgi:hypothetical protein